MIKHWKRIDQISIPNISYLVPSDICIYAKDFVSGTGFRGGVVNDDIINFKKSPNAPGQQFRLRAINKFALEASELFNCDDENTFAVTAVPSSKSKIDPLYDNRFEDFFKQLILFCPCIDIVLRVIANTSILAAHHNGPRNPNILKQNYVYSGFAGNEPETLFVFDDVLTSGAHFRAYKDFIIQSGYKGKVYGVFWAKTI